jgi:hypothetical protein
LPDGPYDIAAFRSIRIRQEPIWPLRSQLSMRGEHNSSLDIIVFCVTHFHRWIRCSSFFMLHANLISQAFGDIMTRHAQN